MGTAVCLLRLHTEITYYKFTNSQQDRAGQGGGGGGGGGGERRGLGPRNDVLTTCKAITLRDGQRIIAACFPF